MGLSESILLYFSGVEDPRVEGRCRHLFLEMIFISVCAVLCGAESFTEIELFSRRKINWLKRFLSLPGGVPSEDTLRRLFQALDPKAFSQSLTQWTLATQVGEKIKRLCFDGKSVAGTDRRVNRHSSTRLHLLNVFDLTNSLALAQVACRSTAATEADAILQCLEYLDIEEALISIDAVCASQRVIGKIREKRGDYLCPIKKNKKMALREIEAVFSSLSPKKIKSASKTEKAHGRVESRKAHVIDASEMSDEFRQTWPGVECIGRITRRRESDDTRPLVRRTDKNGKTLYLKNENTRRVSSETVYYITSRKLTAQQTLKQVRDHWGIENKLHWGLDVSLSEDQWRVRDKNAAANLSTVRKFAFNLLKQAQGKGGKRAKMKQAAWDSSYLEELISEAQF